MSVYIVEYRVYRNGAPTTTPAYFSRDVFKISVATIQDALDFDSIIQRSAFESSGTNDSTHYVSYTISKL